MSFVEDVFKGGNIGTGLAIGIGVAVAGPLLTPLIGGVLRPVTKAVVKAGLLAYDAGREGFERINEASGDIVGEARAEVERDRKPAAGDAGSRSEAGSRTETRAERRASGANA
jgi:hypothetical protein